MISLNETYNKFCNPGFKNYKKISNNIILIDNFFEDFNSSRDFFINRDKWKCISYQNTSKPGYVSLFPNWVGKSLLEKFILDNEIIDDENSYTTTCSFSYEEDSFLWSIYNSSYYPHIDSIQVDNVLMYICLINLSSSTISTNFYSYKNKQYCNHIIYEDWQNYSQKKWEELLKHYNKNFVTREELKNFLDEEQEPDVKLVKTLKYSPNQAIVYPANLFHSSNLTSEFTETNPRSLLRITFDKQITDCESKFSYW